MELLDDFNYFAGNDSPLYQNLLRSIWENGPQMPPEIILEATPMSTVPHIDEDLPRCSTVAKIDSPGRKRAQIVKRQWSPEEDRMLLELVEECGTTRWTDIAQRIGTRLAKQCRTRWHDHLKPNIKKNAWTEYEDLLLVDAHMEFGNKWAKIARRLPGRAENTIKNRWNSAKRRVLAGSLLDDYIISIHPTPTHANEVAQNVSRAGTAIPPIEPDSVRFDAVNLPGFMFDQSWWDEDELSMQEIATPSTLSLSQLEKLKNIEMELMEIIAHVG